MLSRHLTLPLLYTILFLLLVVILTGCDSGQDPEINANNGRSSPAPYSRTEADAQARSLIGQPTLPHGELITIDDEFEHIAQLAPAFGGLYFEETRVLALNLTDLKQETAVLAALVTVIGPEFNDLFTEVRTYEVAFNFAELRQWYRDAMPVWQINGVVSSDINERENRLVYGIMPPATEEAVRAVLSQQGVPEGAVLVIPDAPDQDLITLRDTFNPLIGGIQIQEATRGPGLEGACTFGFNAYLENPGLWGFVTNSHCTLDKFGLDGSTFYQPDISSGNYIGLELKDPLTDSSLPGVLRGPSADIAMLLSFTTTRTSTYHSILELSQELFN